MPHIFRLRPALCLLSVLFISNIAAADNNRYAVTITNLTRAQSFTPILVASHRGETNLFKLGKPASAELAAIAEGGDIIPLATVLEANHNVSDIQNSGGLLTPGQSVTVTVNARRGSNRISLAGMLIPTNDSFIALDSVWAPTGNRSMDYFVPAYDAGSEPNDELCISIPGPICGGEGGSPGIDGEGYVHIHSGIHSIGDLPAADYDWRNPVAKITILHLH